MGGLLGETQRDMGHGEKEREREREREREYHTGWMEKA